MVKTTKEKNDKDYVDKIYQLKKERKPIVYIEIKHESFNTIDIGENEKT